MYKSFLRPVSDYQSMWTSWGILMNSRICTSMIWNLAQVSTIVGWCTLVSSCLFLFLIERCPLQFYYHNTDEPATCGTEEPMCVSWLPRVEPPSDRWGDCHWWLLLGTWSGKLEIRRPLPLCCMHSHRGVQTLCCSVYDVHAVGGEEVVGVSVDLF